jgi:hypothetical protein
MIRPGYPRKRPWAPLEVAIWFLALIIMITVGILVVTKVVGPWALIFGSGIVAAVGLLRYRAETERANRNVDDHED